MLLKYLDFGEIVTLEEVEWLEEVLYQDLTRVPTEAMVTMETRLGFIVRLRGFGRGWRWETYIWNLDST